MKFEPTLLRTRVARRMLSLFMACAVGPVVVLGGVAYVFVAHRMATTDERRAEQDAKVAGQVVLARLQELENELRSFAVATDAGVRYTPPAKDAGVGTLESLATQSEDGRITRVQGSIGELPTLGAARLAQLASGRAVLIVPMGGAPRQVFMAVSAAGRAGAVYPVHWGSASIDAAFEGIGGVSPGVAACIRDDLGPLACIGSDSVLNARHQLDISRPRIGAHQVFLTYEFGTRPWTVELAMAGDAPASPLAEFRRIFLLGLIFTIVLVFTLSHVQIRERMTPLADLEDGTRRLRSGDFTTRVHINTDDEFQLLATSFNQMAGDLERQFGTLGALRAVDTAALKHRNAPAIVSAALQSAPALLGAPAVALATAEGGERRSWPVAIASATDSNLRYEVATPSSPELIELSNINDFLLVDANRIWPSYCRPLRNHFCTTLLVFPIREQRDAIGALIVGVASAGAVSPEIVAVGRQLADQLALGLSNVLLVEELDALSVGALTALARTVDAASHWTAGHSERVTDHAVEIATRLGLGDEAATQLRQGGLLHDIGKIGVPAAILDKAGPLTQEELVVMQSHPTIGAEIVQSVRAFRDLVPLVLHHHELLDGSGYPHGLRGDEIPQLVRVLTVADVYDALVSTRPYRAGLSKDVALDILFKGRGTKFEPAVVDALKEMVYAGWAPSRYTTRATDVELCESDRGMLIAAGFGETAA